MGGSAHASLYPSFLLFGFRDFLQLTTPCTSVSWSHARSKLRSGERRLLGDLTVAAGAILRRALRRTDRLGALQAVAFGAAGWVGQRVGASVHHDGIHSVGHGEGLEVGLDCDGQRELIDEVDRRAGHDGSAAEVLQAEDCREGGHRDEVTVKHPLRENVRF